jgi:hypothetical protein
LRAARAGAVSAERLDEAYSGENSTRTADAQRAAEYFRKAVEQSVPNSSRTKWQASGWLRCRRASFCGRAAGAQEFAVLK